jgi:hypothetical protein
LAIAYDTPLSVVEQLRTRISQYMSENNREWNNSSVWIEKMEFQNAIHLTIALERELEWFPSTIVVDEHAFASRSPQLARLGWTMGTPQRVHEMVQRGLGRARTQVHSSDPTGALAKRNPLPRCLITGAALALRRVLFRFHFRDVPRR